MCGSHKSPAPGRGTAEYTPRGRPFGTSLPLTVSGGCLASSTVVRTVKLKVSMVVTPGCKRNCET